MNGEICKTIRTLRLKVRREAYPWLNAAAIEVNTCWNWANALSDKAARPFAGAARWLTAYDLDKLSAGAAACFEHIGSDTIQRINAEFATRRRQFRKTKLRWPVSRGSKRSLGWIPWKPAQLRRKGWSLRFSGKTIRVFEQDLLEGVSFKCGCFAQDAVGDWWLCVPVESSSVSTVARDEAVGLDLGLKTTVATSDEEKLEAGQFYRGIEPLIAAAQRRGHRRQAKRLHRRAARRRRDALHKFSRRLIDRYQTIIVGDVSSTQLAKTRMAKSVLDAGWGLLKSQLQYKAQQGGRGFHIVSERNTTRACSGCGSLTGPAGPDSLVVRTWRCSACGATHDRDVNAARNILSAWRCPTSVSGNESMPSVIAPRRVTRPRKARRRSRTAAA